MRFYRSTLITLLILFAGFALRVVLHDFHSLEGDDAFSLALSRTPTPELIRGLMRLELDVHPPLHFLALKAWVTVAGESLLSLRLMNILLDVLTGALMVRLARGNILAAVLWAVAPLLIFGGWLARMYTLLGLLVMLAAVCAVQATRERFYLWMAAAAVASLAAMYTHILGVVVYGAVGAVLFFSAWGNWQKWRYVSVVFAMAGALYLPFALRAYSVLAAGGPLGAEVNPANAVLPAEVPFAVVNVAFFHRLALPANWLLPVLLVIVSVAYVRAWRQTWPVFVLFWVMCAGFVLLGAGAGLFKPRYLVGLAPLAMVYVVLPFVQVGEAWPRPYGWVRVLRAGEAWPRPYGWVRVLAGEAWPRPYGWAVLLVVPGMLWGLRQNVQYGWRDDWTAAATFVETYTVPDDAVLVVPDWGQEAMRYHYGGAAPVRGFFPQIVPGLDLDAAFGEYVADHKRVWLVRYQPEVSDPDTLARDWLAARGATVTTIFPAGMEITLFDLSPIGAALPQAARPLDVQYGEALALRGVTLPEEITTSAVNTRLYDESGRVLVALHWEPLQPDVGQTPRVRLTDTFGQVYGGTLDPTNGVLARHPVNSWQPGEVITITYDINLNPETPSGIYNIEVMVLDETGAPLTTTGADAGEFWAVAGQVRVE